jgi:hypothetical protein
MKRALIVVAVAVLASPALALEVGPPFEQNQLDRMLPDIQFAPVAPYVPDARAPYEQLVIDRALPQLPERLRQFAGAAGDTRTDAGPDGQVSAESPWAHDWNFIAPPL